MVVARPLMSLAAFTSVVPPAEEEEEGAAAQKKTSTLPMEGGFMGALLLSLL